jgi:hypothetical protein
MIKDRKIHDILDIIEIPKSMEHNKCTHLKNHELFFKLFFMIFKSSVGPKKSKDDVPSSTTQRWVYPMFINLCFF